jgi:hypothetical protein
MPCFRQLVARISPCSPGCVSMPICARGLVYRVEFGQIITWIPMFYPATIIILILHTHMSFVLMKIYNFSHLQLLQIKYFPHLLPPHPWQSVTQYRLIIRSCTAWITEPFKVNLYLCAIQFFFLPESIKNYCDNWVFKM